ncbi:MAG: HlyD family efflux transporter periplasmic adaptor subunit [Pedobacter sp.]|nr:HlyD family efflux transporter periplasmic adaptor subunit [Pedobacter sp.]
MKKRCAFALPLLLAGCGGEELPRFQGYVDVDLVRLAPSQSGHLQELLVERGDSVTLDQTLARLEATPENAALAQSRAQLVQAQATARDLDTGKRPEEIAVIRAQLAQAESNRQLAERQLKRQREVFSKGYVSQQDLDRQQTLLDSQTAQVAELRAQLKTAELAARSQQRKAAEAGIAATKAGEDLNRWKLDEKTLHAPENGRIEQIYFRPGEWVNAGQPVLDLYAPAHLKIRFFVPQASLPKLKPGLVVKVHCDGCPAEIPATIRFISEQSEFTPPVIYSQEQRQKLVYLVEATPSQAEHLRAGQPVDILLADNQPAQK